ncbi:hypothetical protein [Bacillus sp. 37MA]|uniref:hypothetical protein n=1 Tax=Bacillus sp. 37MA TaxID=1132442 RepID=UPI00037BEE23|nr:hypothetical protein [Bacillus sp. 37MA]
MAIPEDKTRIQVIIPKESKLALQKVAKANNRKVSNYVATLIQNHLDELKEQGKIPPLD